MQLFDISAGKMVPIFSFEHHRHTHIPGKDPELDDPKPSTLAQYLVYVSGIPIWKSQLKTLYKNAFAVSITASYLIPHMPMYVAKPG